MVFVLVHELGHLFFAKIIKVKTKGFYFIPFFGGAALVDNPYERWKDFFVAIGGPIFSTILSLVLLFICIKYDSSSLFLYSVTLFLINLLNLLPIYPLDGGRMVVAIGMSITDKFQWFIRIFGILLIIFLYYIKIINLFFLILFVLYYALTTLGELPDEDLYGERMKFWGITISVFSYLLIILLNFSPVIYLIYLASKQK